MRLSLVIPTSVVEPVRGLFVAVLNWAKHIHGECLEDGTVTYKKLVLKTRDIPVAKVDWPEHHVVLTPFMASTTSTSEVACSGAIRWNPTNYYPTTGGKWYFEATIGISDAAQTVTCRLMGLSAVSTLTRTGATSLARVRSGALTMPAAAVDLYCDLKTSDAGATAWFAGARLVFVPE